MFILEIAAGIGLAYIAGMVILAILLNIGR